MASSLLGMLKRGVNEAHDSEEFADCKIICGPYQRNVRKIILSSQSGDLAAEKFEDTIKYLWNHEVLAEVVTIVFNSTPDEVAQLRNIVIDTMYSHLETIKDKKEIQAVLSEIPRLAYILLKRKCNEKPVKVVKDIPSSVGEVDYGGIRHCLVCDQYPLSWSGADVDLCRDCWEARSSWE